MQSVPWIGDKTHRKIAVIVLLVLIFVAISIYFHFVLHSDVVFSHLFYVPIALAALWWGRRGIWIAVLLGVFLIVLRILSGLDTPPQENVFRAFMFIVVGLMVAVLTERALRSEANLAETRDYLDNLIRYANAPIIVWSPDFKITRFNHAFERLTGQSSDEVLGASLDVLFPEDSCDQAMDYIHRAATGARWEAVEILIQHVDGSVRTVLWNSANIYASDGTTVIATIAQGQDITERVMTQQTLEQRVEERTREIERRRSVAEGLRDILTVLNSNRSLDEILDFILAQASRLLGAKAVAIYSLQRDGELLTIEAARGLDPDYVADAVIPVGQSVTGRAVLERQPVTLSDITAFSLDDDLMVDQRRQALLERLVSEYRALLAVPLMNVETFGAITLYYQEPRDFTDEQIRMAVAFGDQVVLAIQNAQLRAQVEESAVAAERSRLARELHDSVTQILFSASLIAEVLPVVWKRDPVEGQQALEEMRELTRGALAEMRTLLMELRPAALTKAKIDNLLRQLAEGVTGRARIPVVVTVEDLRPLPPDVKIALYRIAQEALNNVAKHAEAGQATVSLHCYLPESPLGSSGSTGEDEHVEERVGKVELRVQDDGRGFVADQVPPDHLGLDIMRERAEAIGASLAIESQLGRGTQVIVTWQNEKWKEQHGWIESDPSTNR